jgi:hypothetical protein
MGPNADPRVNCCTFGQLLSQHTRIGLIDLFYSRRPANAARLRPVMMSLAGWRDLSLWAND